MKNNVFKKIIVILCAVFMFLGVMPVGTFAGSNTLYNVPDVYASNARNIAGVTMTNGGISVVFCATSSFNKITVPIYSLNGIDRSNSLHIELFLKEYDVIYESVPDSGKVNCPSLYLIESTRSYYASDFNPDNYDHTVWDGDEIVLTSGMTEVSTAVSEMPAGWYVLTVMVYGYYNSSASVSFCGVPSGNDNYLADKFDFFERITTGRVKDYQSVPVIFAVSASSSNANTFWGSIKENVIVRGDFDEDGDVTIQDAEYLLNSILFGEASYPLNQSGDLDLLNYTNIQDVEYLLNHVLFGEEAYPFNH